MTNGIIIHFALPALLGGWAKFMAKRVKNTSLENVKHIFVFTSKKAALGDLVVFIRQFSTLISAGISITKCLSALEKQTENVVLKKAVARIRIDIENGSSLSEAMEKYPVLFSEFFIALIKAAEEAGILDKVLLRLADHIEKQDNLRRTVRNAFSYPVVVGVLSLLVIGFLVIVIVPVFSDIYKRLGVTLPTPTLALVVISDFVRKFWWMILILTVTGIVGLNRAAKNTVCREVMDNIKLKVPVFGRLIRRSSAARFIRTFGDMISSGIIIQESLKVADKVANNKAVSEIANKMIENVQSGKLISEALNDQNIFPPSTVQMIASGEESGALDYMLEKSADALERDVDDIVKRLVVKIEPIMTFFMAILVGFIAIALYLPIFDMITQMTAAG